MYRLKQNEVSALEIAQFLNSEFVGPNFMVSMARTLAAPAPGCVLCVDQLTAEVVTTLQPIGPILIIAPNALAVPACAVVIAARPQLAFARVINEFFVEREWPAIHSTAIVEPRAKLGRDVSIGPYCMVSADAEIGEETELQHGVVINGAVQVGCRCLIKSGAVIGSERYGFVNDEHNRPVSVPQFGRIEIGDETWIGAHATIERATFANTVVGRNVKIDDLVHVGNGSHIGDNSMITAGTVLSENVRVGRRCWIMPGCRVRSNVTIADGVTLGIGSVLLQDITDAEAVYVGSPAQPLPGR